MSWENNYIENVDEYYNADSWFKRNIWENPFINPIAGIYTATHGARTKGTIRNMEESKLAIATLESENKKLINQLNTKSFDASKSSAINQNNSTKYLIVGALVTGMVLVTALAIRKRLKK